MSTQSRQALNLIRSGSTLRFHTHAGLSLKTQDVAQHSYGVFWLVYVLTGGAPSAGLLVNAMAHDAGEPWVGDVPAPTKRQIPGLSAELGRMEAEALETYTGIVAPELAPWEVVVLKLADYLDGAAFCDREWRLGNTLMRAVMHNFVEYADECYYNNADHLCAKDTRFDFTAFNGLMDYFRSIAK